jgi:hypothetical protein
MALALPFFDNLLFFRDNQLNKIGEFIDSHVCLFSTYPPYSGVSHGFSHNASWS